MKKILKYLLFISIITISITTYQSAFADKNEDCINSLKETEAVSFTKMTGYIKNKTTVLKINSKECKGIPIKISLFSLKDGPSEWLSYGPIEFYWTNTNKTDTIPEITPTEDTVLIAIQTNEAYCYGSYNNPDCLIYTSITAGDYEFSSRDNLINILKTFDYNKDKQIPDEAFNEGILFGQCEGSCGSDNWFALIKGGTMMNDEKIQKCRKSLDKVGAVTVNYLDKITSRRTILKIKTGDCKDMSLKFSFNSTKQGFVWGDLLFFVPVYNIYYATYKIYSSFNDEVTIDDEIHGKHGVSEIDFVPKDDLVTFTLIANDNGCYGSNDPNCIIIPRIKTKEEGYDLYNLDTATIKLKLEEYQKDNTSDSAKEDIAKEVAKNGVIFANCDSSDCAIAGNNWDLKKMTGAYDNGNSPQSVDTIIKFDYDSPCYSETEGINPLTGEVGKGYLPNCYEFLAPIQGIENDTEGKFDSKTFKKSDNGKRIAIRDISTYELGNYINKLFQIAIAILGVMSVIMIIIAGVQYMTEESIYGKSDAKKHITSAVTGLLLSLSIFIILHTINPKLLEVNFGKNINTVSMNDGDGAVVYDSVNHTAQHPKYNYSGNWPPASENFKTIRKGGKNSTETIIPGVYVKNKECDYVGDACTSLYFDNSSYNKIINGLTKLKKDSGASKIIITGGSEYWLHKTHGPKSAILDLRSSNSGENDATSISKYLAGSENYPGQCYEHMGISSYISSALDENGNGGGSLCDKKNNKYPSPQEVINARKSPIQKKTNTTIKKRSCCWNSSQHWHIIFK